MWRTGVSVPSGPRSRSRRPIPGSRSCRSRSRCLAGCCSAARRRGLAPPRIRVGSRASPTAWTPRTRGIPGISTSRSASGASGRVDWQVTITRIVHRRLRYRRRCDCPGPRTVTAPPAPNPIAKGRFTASFLARLLYDKYVLGLPVHRIVRALAADGLDVAEGTVCGALRAVADLLVPLEEAIVARNAEARHAHADETSWRVFERPEDKEGY